jgi:hypothetical protein
LVPTAPIGGIRLITDPAPLQDNVVTTVSATSTSAAGTYLIDYPAFDDVEDTSGNRYRCSYTSYDGQPFTTGQTGLAAAVADWGCGVPVSWVGVTGLRRTTATFGRRSLYLSASTRSGRTQRVALSSTKSLLSSWRSRFGGRRGFRTPDLQHVNQLLLAAAVPYACSDQLQRDAPHLAAGE